MQETAKKLRVVIAEDDRLVSTYVAAAAQEAGFEVLGVAADGEEALEMARETSPDAIIMDIQMPKMDGLAAAERIRDEFHLPVVIMTACETNEFFQKAKQAGVSAYLTKPPQAESMRRAVEIAVERQREIARLAGDNVQLRESLDKAKTLTGIVSICAACKKIRNERGRWEPIEAYLMRHLDVEFSHGVCPECVIKLYPEYSE